MNKEATKPPAIPRDLREYLWYVRRYETGIYVREQIHGKWGNSRLADLSPKRWAHHVAKWFNENRIPWRIKEDDP